MKKFLVIVLCLCLLLCYFIGISYLTIDVSEYKLESDKIEHDVHIVMIADVHDDHCLIKDQIIERIQELKPDMILCVGDLIDDHSSNNEDMIDFLGQLCDISDVYMSLGNHEYDYYDGHIEDLKRIENIGVHLLDNQYEDISINGNQIRVGGMYDYAFGMKEGKITKSDMDNNETYQFLTDFCDTSSYTLMMAHRPDSFIYGEAYQWDIDLVLSGHVHGGQVVLPFIGGLYAPEQGWNPYYDYGLFYMDNMKMIITRGISSSDEFLPRVNNPAEIASIKLTKE